MIAIFHIQELNLQKEIQRQNIEIKRLSENPQKNKIYSEIFQKYETEVSFLKNKLLLYENEEDLNANQKVMEQNYLKTMI